MIFISICLMFCFLLLLLRKANRFWFDLRERERENQLTENVFTFREFRVKEYVFSGND